MDELAKIKHMVSTKFKVSGFFIKSDSAEYLAGMLLPLNVDDRNKWLKDILSHIQQQGTNSLHIERDHLDLAIRDCTNKGLDENETIFSVISAFEVPRFKYNEDRKKFTIDSESTRSFIADCSMKSQYIRDRYVLLWQRTIRHPLFASNPVLSETRPTFQLKKVEQLLSSSKLKDIVVLGLLTQLSEGKYYIEDPTGAVQIDISSATMHSGLFCEGCFVLAEGTYSDEVLKVTGLGFPPPEMANSSRAFFGTANTWGGKSKILLKYSKKLAELEKKNELDGIVFMSECWLDVPLVMQKLKILFKGYDEFPPIAIVLMGPFMKTFENPHDLKIHLNTLSELINSTNRLKRETYIVMVPANEDPISVNVLPRPPLPESLTSEMQKKCPKVIFTTNPCRIQYCTQQIVIMKSELVTKLCRNTIKFPSSGTLDDHFTRTLISQGTLAPLHPIALPTFWDLDAAMTLYPLPDLVVIGDPSNAFHAKHHDCTVINTGSFPKSNFAFKVYMAASKTVEDSELPDDDDSV
uniref:DNA polymerase epsilon subunit n=1 Tax=Culicoides sonorensis TaxID=179676 RepID=A0A336M4A5_CULSO